MDFQEFVNNVAMPCCVMSVEKKADGSCGEIRIIAANPIYKEVMGPAYYDGMLYQELVPKDNKFEDFCFRAAILKQRMHAYVETRALDAWTDQTIIPLRSARDDIGYCQFIFEFTQYADAERMADVSMTAAAVIIRSCMTLLGSSEFRPAVTDVLRLVMESAEAKGARILLIDHERKTVSNYCEVMSRDAKPLHKPGEMFFTYELIETWEQVIGESNDVIVRNDRDMEQIALKNPEWAQDMRKNRLKSMVLVPLRRGEEVIGYLYVVNFNVAKVVEVKEIVELLSYILGAEIYNYLLLKKLEEISRVDSLTGILNRRAMKSCMKELECAEERKPFGVVSVDLNGLKTVNDKDGHEAGDRLLISAGDLLRKAFREDDLFRTGGDEFIVISSGITRDSFYQRVEKLIRDEGEHEQVNFAIGAYWSDGTVDVRTAIRLSDEDMYANKAEFYERHPELMRK